MRNLKNKLHLIGRIGNEVTLMETKNSRSLLRLSLAVNDVYYDAKGQKIEKTDWFNLISWGLTAERMAKSLNKGDQIMVEAHLANNKWEDKDGNTRYDIDIIVDNFMLVQPKRNSFEQEEEMQEAAAEA